MTSVSGIARNWREVAQTLGISVYRQLVSKDPNEIDAFVGDKGGRYQLAWEDDQRHPIEGPGESVAEVALFIQSHFEAPLLVTRCGPEDRPKRELEADFNGVSFEDTVIRRERQPDGQWSEEETDRGDYEYQRLVGALAPTLKALGFHGTVYAYYDVAEGGIILTGWGFDNAHAGSTDLD